MGQKGPPPKRSSERRRRNKESKPEKVAAGAAVEVPEPDGDWHEIAKRWFQSLGRSGQSQFYEPSDWAMAYLIAESISRDLKPQAIGIVEDGPKAGEVVRAVIPMKGASLSAYLKAMTALMVSEGDRRRMRMEIERGEGEEAEPAGVTALNEYRRKLAG